MSTLIRGTRENFNPQIHTEANSLTSQMKKHFEVRRKSMDLFARYTKFTSFMFASGRYNGGSQSGKVMSAAKDGLMDNAYRIAYEGALLLPAYSMGAAQIGSWFDAGNSQPNMSGVVGVQYTNGILVSTVVTDVAGSIAIQHDPANEVYGDKFNPNDSIVLNSGLGSLFIIQQHPRRSSDGTHYVLDGKFVGTANLFKEEYLAEGEVMTEGGNYFGEGSLRGWQRYTRSKWRINYSSIHRASMTMTGSAKKQKIAWIVNPENGSKMWEYDEVMKNDKIFHMQNELALRFSRISMDATDHSWFENYGRNQLTLSGFKAESGLTAPMLGDGWIPQIQDNFTFDYNPNTGLSYLALESLMMILGQRSPVGSSGNTFVGVGDAVGHMVIDRAFKKLVGFGNNAVNTASGTMDESVLNIKTGQDNTLGFKITSYFYLDNTFVFIQDDIFNNPGLFNTSGGVTGTGNIYVLNASMVDGVSNFELFARSGRDLVRKNENGMHSFDESQDNSSVASSGFDGCSIHTLSELLPILYDVRSCAIIRASAKYNGGALSGTPIATGVNQATKFLY
jgi:hypothetical protein